MRLLQYMCPRHYALRALSLPSRGHVLCIPLPYAPFKPPRQAPDSSP